MPNLITSYCPLCKIPDRSRFYFEDKKRQYVMCSQCSLVYVKPEFLPDKNSELSEYQLHENNIEDDGYRRFLQRLLAPLIRNIQLHSSTTAIDFGCGPAPVLATMLAQHNVTVSIYDPFFFPDNRVLNQQYDIIMCSEAIEHFHYPHKEWAMWQNMLKPNGTIAIMTKRVIDKNRFSTWHYKNDPTHVSFFSEATFRFLAERDGYTLEIPANDVVLMKKV